MQNRQLQLQPRLQLLADLVPSGARLADVGTDHGYLPVWLLQHGRISAAIAADIGPEPLEHARRTAAEYGVQGINFRLCDGLRGIAPEEADTGVLAGMGGETMIHILSAAPWTRCPGAVTLLLQPMTKAGDLRRWLSDNGYCFTQERLVRDKDFLYPVLVVTGGTQPPLTKFQQEYGLLLSKDPLYGDYLDLHLRRLEQAEAGMLRSDQETVRARASEIAALRAEMKQAREEWQG